MKVKIKRLNEKAVMPTKAHPTDAGFDLVATSREIDEYGNIVYGTGLAFEIPEGYAGFIFPRSSICKKDLMLANSTGIIDCHYRGEVTLKFRPVLTAWENIDDTGCFETLVGGFHDAQEVTDYEVGDRIGQLIIEKLEAVDLEEADTLSETDRGTGGYGSTGK